MCPALAGEPFTSEDPSDNIGRRLEGLSLAGAMQCSLCPGEVIPPSHVTSVWIAGSPVAAHLALRRNTHGSHNIVWWRLGYCGFFFSFFRKHLRQRTDPVWVCWFSSPAERAPAKSILRVKEPGSSWAQVPLTLDAAFDWKGRGCWSSWRWHACYQVHWWFYQC